MHDNAQTKSPLPDGAKFLQVCRDHAARYPLMEPQDYCKLAYQSEFGPEHMITGPEQVFDWLLDEWLEVRFAPKMPPEPIGGGLCRFHLTCEYEPHRAAGLLSELFWRTARQHKGTSAGLGAKLAVLLELDVQGMDEYLEDYKSRGCPPIHHSAPFSTAYRPHYRLLTLDYAVAFPALLQRKD